MSRRSLSRYRREVDYWPGWVDALSALTVAVLFVLTVMGVGQAALQAGVVGRDQQLDELGRQLQALRTSLGAAEGERARLAGALETSQAARVEDQAAADVRAGALSAEMEALRAEIQRLLALLATGEAAAQAASDAQAAKITDLEAQLKAALARKVEELARYRSDFFGRLRQVLGERSDIRIVGDRFVFQSEVLFQPGSAELGAAGQTQLASLAATLRELAAQIPPEVDWVLRVDGHTDDRPIATPQFPSNWELSTARAVTVVKYLESQGIAPNRLAAAGFAQYRPLEAGEAGAPPGTATGAAAAPQAARDRNRRIELKLDQR